MSLTPSRMIPLKTPAPDFRLLEPLTGGYRDFKSIAGSEGTVVMFLSNHCPFVQHIQAKLIAVAREFLPQGIGFVGINSNDFHAYPDDSPEQMAQLARLQDLPYPYLLDSRQEIASAYQATCTPDFYLFDSGIDSGIDSRGICVYRGRFDESTPGNGIPVTGDHLVGVLKALLNHQEISPIQYPSFGCNIKWKKPE